MKKGGLFKKIIIGVIGLGILGAMFGGNDDKTKDKVEEKPNQTTQVAKETPKEPVKEVLKLDVRSPYRKVKTLNKNTDMPNDEILYKLPVGEYNVTTDFEKVVTLAVVKDKINTIEGDYPEELIYVSDIIQISSKPENFKKGFAKKEATIEIKKGELLSVPNDNTVFVEPK